MRKILRTAIAIGGIAIAAPAMGQGVTDPQSVIVLPDRSSVYNQSTVSLPTMSQPNGQDEVRAANGVSCRSSVATNGPYVDFGVIGSNDLYDRNAASVYGRVVVPLGKKPKRLDCTELYELEIQRLKVELEMARMGLGVMDVVPMEPVN